MSAAAGQGATASELVRNALVFYLDNIVRGNIAERLERLEHEVAELKRILKKLVSENSKKKRKLW
mgnify:CR=1 FL=1